MRNLHSFLFGKAGLFADRRGATAVEFALILPVMVLIYMSTVEISLAVATQRRVAIASGTMGDLAAQYDSMNADSVDMVLSSAFAVLQPYSPAEMTVRIASYLVDENGSPDVDWSYKIWRVNHVNQEKEEDNGWWRTRGEIPPDLRVPNTSVVVARVDYSYISPIGALFPEGRSMTQTVYFRPRLGSRIPFQSSTASQTWPLPTSGDEGTQINRDIAGFGVEYGFQPRTVMRTDSGHANEDNPPQELQDAWTCETSPEGCEPGGGYGGYGCNYFNEEHLGEIYMAPVCYSPRREKRG